MYVELHQRYVKFTTLFNFSIHHPAVIHIEDADMLVSSFPQYVRARPRLANSIMIAKNQHVDDCERPLSVMTLSLTAVVYPRTALDVSLLTITPVPHMHFFSHSFLLFSPA